MYGSYKLCTERNSIPVIKIVADSSALILLAKCNLLEILCDSYEVISPSSVMSEVASGEIIKNYPDAIVIASLSSKGKIKIQDPKKGKFRLPLSLHRGEKDALLLAVERQNCLFATDDGKAIKAAKFMKIPFIIAPKIVIELFRLKKLSFKDARQSIEKLSMIGRYSPDIIADALVLLMEGKNDKAHNHKVT